MCPLLGGLTVVYITAITTDAWVYKVCLDHEVLLYINSFNL